MHSRIKMAGQFLKDKDEAYANALHSLIDKHIGGKNPILDSAVQIGTMPLQKLQYESAPGVFREPTDFIETAAQYGFPAISGAVRYGVPAAGLVGLQQGIAGLYDVIPSAPVMGNNPQ